MEYKNYSEVPWYRTSTTNGWFAFLGFFLAPFIWVVAFMLITGDVYYNEVDKDGNLTKWSLANKIAAWLIAIVLTLFWSMRIFRAFGL